mmetsp:Transcript_24291/g.65214  ORF Transcript_24291/g.65214 Transcript_24291/m.65214 type:complete len:83 (+) Transcript_24291:606-854(+)
MLAQMLKDEEDVSDDAVIVVCSKCHLVHYLLAKAQERRAPALRLRGSCQAQDLPPAHRGLQLHPVLSVPKAVQHLLPPSIAE